MCQEVDGDVSGQEARRVTTAEDIAAGFPMRDFRRFAADWWKLFDKLGNELYFQLNPAQRLIEAEILRMQRAGRPVRLRVLKYRQAGVSSWATARMLHLALTHKGWVSLSIADKQDLPAQWLRRCQRWMEQLPGEPPSVRARNALEIWLDKLHSRYYIGSAEGTTPGMGDTIRGLHCSEIASWRHPEPLLGDLLPALPPGPGTYLIQESTGRLRGDWWYQRYHAAKRGDEDYVALFLPWFIQPEYRDNPDEVLSHTDYEKGLLTLGCDDAQLAWRRRMLRDEFYGDEALFANQFPATEEEAFLAGGRNVFSTDEVSKARATIRPPVWRGDLLPSRNPSEFKLVGSGSSQLLIWDHDPQKNEKPDPTRTYVIGADCQWGRRGEDPDFDAAYVECVETGKICAALYGRFDMGLWSKLLASVGFYYGNAVLAPERNSEAAKGVILPLLGQAGNNWKYPNIYVRDKRKRFGIRAPEDYGFLTDKHTKPDLVITTKERIDSIRGMDWADKRLVEELEAYIVDDTMTYTAPEGQHDDKLMARMITSYVSRDVWNELALRRPKADWGDLPDHQRRFLEQMEKFDREDEERRQPPREPW
jgi:hypothetical protein